MPNKFVTLDTGFPTFSGDESLSEKVDSIINYQYQLQESLRYMLRHLDKDNFDEDGLRSITDPISLSLQEDFNSLELDIDAGGISAIIEGLESKLELYVTSAQFNSTIRTIDGKVSSLEQTVDGFSTTIENQNGEISRLEQTVNGFSTTVSQQNGKISSLEQTVNGFKTTVSQQNGKISSLEQTVNGFDTRVSDAEGNISSLEQTVDSFSISVSSSSTGTSTFKLTADGATLSTQTVDLRVKAANIYGKLTANQIETGALSAGLIAGDTVYIEDSEGYNAGYIQTTDTTNGNGLLLEGTAGLKLMSPGNVLIRGHTRSGTAYAPEIILQWTDPDDPFSSAITLQGGALILGNEIFGSYLPDNPVYGQVYFLR